MPARVSIVLLPDFAAQLPELARRSDVWVIDTPVNHAAAEVEWATHEQKGDSGVTTFQFESDQSAEEWLIAILPMVDVHHGLQAAWPSEVEIAVVGARLTTAVRAALEAFGPFDFAVEQGGFVARRTPAG